MSEEIQTLAADVIGTLRRPAPAGSMSIYVNRMGEIASAVRWTQSNDMTCWEFSQFQTAVAALGQLERESMVKDIDRVYPSCSSSLPPLSPDMIESLDDPSAERDLRKSHHGRIYFLYRAHPLPRRKIRKCHLRKIHAARAAGRRRIRRLEPLRRVQRLTNHVITMLRESPAREEQQWRISSRLPLR